MGPFWGLGGLWLWNKNLLSVKSCSHWRSFKAIHDNLWSPGTIFLKLLKNIRPSLYAIKKAVPSLSKGVLASICESAKKIENPLRIDRFMSDYVWNLSLDEYSYMANHCLCPCSTLGLRVLALRNLNDYKPLWIQPCELQLVHAYQTIKFPGNWTQYPK